MDRPIRCRGKARDRVERSHMDGSAENGPNSSETRNACVPVAVFGAIISEERRTGDFLGGGDSSPTPYKSDNKEEHCHDGHQSDEGGHRSSAGKVQPSCRSAVGGVG